MMNATYAAVESPPINPMGIAINIADGDIAGIRRDLGRGRRIDGGIACESVASLKRDRSRAMAGTGPSVSG